ncbi:GumC family protein [Hymenobacter sp. GOD-10R]|uniref:GumC family protein n=1 Tax=Hymenobacter sp. GOD-10R TaxID=3093922 RepID=UPI002D7857D0|nr:polysaccharide biosynthesis tyrosine autokinase [Hymenobacter sp. GOD-10R]WRQ30345.1 polysaccharide biosynthesis tyrosine autokinase [Hymenobacter sp. GOD-10R]
MSQQQYIVRSSSSEGENKLPDLKSAFADYLPYWPWILGSLLVFATIAIGYLKIVKPTYEIKASILVQDTNKNPNNKSALQEIDLAESPKVAENEIEVLKSHELINQAIVNLQLWTRYFTSDAFVPEELYTNSPVAYHLITASNSTYDQTLKVVVVSKDSFNVIGKDAKTHTYAFNSPIQSDGATWQLQAKQNIQDFLGETITIQLENPEKVAERYQKSMVVELLNKQAPAIGLAIDDQVPERGKSLLDHLIQLYNGKAIAEKNRTTQSTLDFIDKRLAVLSGELNSLESKVEGFRSSHGLTDITSQSSMYLENVQSNDTQLNKVNIELGVIDEISRYVNAPDFKGVPATMGIDDPTLSSLIEKLSSLQLQREKLLATTPETNPVFEPINKQINATRSAIIGSVRTLKASLLGTKRQLQATTGKLASSIRNVPVQERQLVSIKRQQTIKENLYLYLLQKREEVGLSYAPLLADARIVDQAYTASVKWPKKPFVLALAMLLGLALPCGVILVKEGIRNRIRGGKEVEALSQLPLLTELVMQKTSTPLVVSSADYAAIGEQFRWLRTSLRSLHGHISKGRVTLLTSSISGEGKSFVCSNLGVTLGLAGRKTVLLELDLRKPRQSAVFELDENHYGASDFLLGACSIEEVIQPSRVTPNLDIIASGTLVPNPSELLEHEHLELLIKQLKERYDDVLIDTPPAYLVTDAIIVAPLSDVTLYIMRESYTLKSLLPFVQKQYKEGVFPRMNVVFNGAKLDKSSYNYQDYYAKTAAHS